MRISLEKPPIFEEASKNFGVTEKDPIWYTFGDTIYAPCGKMPPDDIIRHEEVHAEQQQYDPSVAKIWWQRYFLDSEFRIEQEAEAYGEQFRFLKGRYKDRNAQARILHSLGEILSRKQYGSAISRFDAMKKIKDYADGTALNGIEEHIKDTIENQ